MVREMAERFLRAAACWPSKSRGAAARVAALHDLFAGYGLTLADDGEVKTLSDTQKMVECGMYRVTITAPNDDIKPLDLTTPDEAAARTVFARAITFPGETVTLWREHEALETREATGPENNV